MRRAVKLAQLAAVVFTAASAFAQTVAPVAPPPAAGIASMPALGRTTPDLSGVWTGIGDGQTPSGLKNTAWPTEPGFTAQGSAKFAATDKAKDPMVTRCLPPGVARFMSADSQSPIEIIQSGQSITMLTAKTYQARRLYWDGRGRLGLYDYWTPTYTGHSLARWEGDTLVVETERLNDKAWLSDTGLPQSAQLKVTERIRRIEDGKVLHDRLTLEDPTLYTKPLTVDRYWQLTPNAEIGEASFSCQEKRNRS
jgi:hypothetical protein